MAFTDNPSPNSPVPDEFALHVKQVLENFYNFPFLNNYPLAKTIQIARLRPSETDGQRLRRIFLAVIEEQKPGNEAAQKTVQARYYNLINLRYVESATMQHVAHELGISERQAYRDLKKAEENLAASLWSKVGYALVDSFPEHLAQREEADSAAEQVEISLRPVNVQELIQYATHAVERLAQQQGVKVLSDLSPQPVILSTDPRLAQQVLINLLSQVLQHEQTAELTMFLTMDTGQPVINIHVKFRESLEPVQLANPITHQFIAQLGWRLESQLTEGAFTQEICIQTGSRETIILVIDDHPPLIELLRRFLTQTRCKVVGASDAQKGLDQAKALRPDLILLDVMMPDIDGWEVLQRLRNMPETATIPVVICSIFNDPKLAYSLGATELLTKPVSREKLLDLLKRLEIIG